LQNDYLINKSDINLFYIKWHRHMVLVSIVRNILLGKTLDNHIVKCQEKIATRTCSNCEHPFSDKRTYNYDVEHKISNDKLTIT